MTTSFVVSAVDPHAGHARVELAKFAGDAGKTAASAHAARLAVEGSGWRDVRVDEREEEEQDGGGK